jgi:hypothetical protein
VADFCDHGNEPSDSIKWLRYYLFIKYGIDVMPLEHTHTKQTYFFKFTTSSNNNMADARTIEPPATVSFKPRKKKYENLLKVIFLGAQNNKILDVR